MGLPSDAEELMGKALRDVKAQKLRRLLWALGTAAFTVVSTTATVSWKMSAYITRAEERDDKLRQDILVMDKKIEKLEALEDNVRQAQNTADKALLYAQFTGQKNGVAKP